MSKTIISVEPSSYLVDDKVKIFVTGLQPKQNVTLQARIAGEKGEVFESYAHYIAAKDGGVDVSCDSSLGGFYRGVEPMGLLWSIVHSAGRWTFPRFVGVILEGTFLNRIARIVNIKLH